jgi:hypothetical protein
MVGAAALLGIVAILVLGRVLPEWLNQQSQQLTDGSTLVLNRVSFSGTNEFMHGSFAEKLLRNVIPAKGIKLLALQLARPTRQTFRYPSGKSQLAVEFQLISASMRSDRNGA